MTRTEFMKTTQLLSEVPDVFLERIGSQMEEIRFPEGTVIFREGNAGDAVYLVVEGIISIERRNIQLLTLGAGATVGEFALVDDGPRSASVVAQTDAILLKWERDAFQSMLTECYEVASGILKILTGKLRREVDMRVESTLIQERWRQDIHRAHEIQMGMLPGEDLRTDHIIISGYCRPAASIGGDYYDYLVLNDERLGLFIGDVAGHGFYSGLFVAMAKSSLHSNTSHGYHPDQIMESMNRTLSLSLQSNMFMTSFYALFDPAACTLTYCNAGHPYPYHYVAKEKRLEALPSIDPPLGIPGLHRRTFTCRETSWEPGDLLIVYSDGITEAENSEGAMFDEQRLEDTIHANADQSPVTVRDSILEAVHNFTCDAATVDDITLVVAQAQG